MSFLTGRKSTQAQQQPAISGLQIQTSAYGKTIPLVYGATRIAPNLIDYADFTAIAHQSSPSGAGKGGGGGGGKGGGGSTTYTYTVAVALGLCEGPINGIGAVWASKAQTTVASLGLTVFAGTYPQAPWSYWSSAHGPSFGQIATGSGSYTTGPAEPEHALGYNGLAYVAGAPYDLGDSANLPNHTFEVYGVGYGGLVAGVPDADPSAVVADLLTNSHYGAGFPPSRIGGLSTYRSYCGAAGLWISPAYTEQQQASQILEDIATYTNSAWVWSSGKLTLVPYGDSDLSANGFAYTAPRAPLYDLTDDDFLPSAGASGGAPSDGDPVLLTRKRPADRVNNITLEYLNRANQYNPEPVEFKDQAAIDLYGLRPDRSRQAHLFADGNAARRSVQLLGQRQAIANTYQFTLDQRYVLLDPMDIVTITDAGLGLDRQWVRITEITEDDDGNLAVAAEEYLAGTGAAAQYGFQQGRPYAVDYNAPPGDANVPIIFEPPDALAGGLEVWMAVSGAANWGGAEIWVSYDGEAYQNVGRVIGPARQGVLTAPLQAVEPAATGPTLDRSGTLAVDLSGSAGQLLSGTQADALALNTACWVDGEIIAYQTASLVGANAYALSYLVRGAYGTPIAAHAAGAGFARLDGGIVHLPFTADRIGRTIYVKLTSFNVYGGGNQTLASVQPYAYTIRGVALASPLPDVRNLTSSFIANLTYLTWDEVADFRPVQYEIRKGASWSGAQVLGRVAHPPFLAQGDGTYWVTAYSQPASGIEAYSLVRARLAIEGATLVANVVASWEESATGWPGTLHGTAVQTGSQIETTDAGDVLAVVDWLAVAEIFALSGRQGNGIYEIPAAHVVDIGRVAVCPVIITWLSIGQIVGSDVLTIVDYLGTTDMLGYAASANTDIYPEIALSQDGVTWGAWQKYAPGAYSARKFKARMQLKTTDPQTQAILQGFAFTVDAPDRIDHYLSLSVPVGGLALQFKPDGSGIAVPFNGGPNGSTVPIWSIDVLGATSGDTVVVTGLTASGCTIQVKNGGAGTARTVNAVFEGY